jgi:hypothetical protein
LNDVMLPASDPHSSLSARNTEPDALDVSHAAAERRGITAVRA